MQHLYLTCCTSQVSVGERGNRRNVFLKTSVLHTVDFISTRPTALKPGSTTFSLPGRRAQLTGFQRSVEHNQSIRQMVLEVAGTLRTHSPMEAISCQDHRLLQSAGAKSGSR